MEFVAAAAERSGPGDLAVPAHGAGRQRVEQQVPQLGALHLGSATRPVVGVVDEDGAVRVEHPVVLAALEDEPAEPLGQAGRGEGRLAGVVVDVEHPALGAGGGGGVGLVDRARDAAHSQDAGEDEAPETAPDDRDRVHGPDGARRRWHGTGTALTRPW